MCVKRIAVILLVAAGCKKPAPAGGVDAGSGVVAAAETADAGFVLTTEMLEAYLAYQKAAAAANGGGPATGRAERDEAALKASGLTDEQLERIDEMVSTVVARRMVMQLAGNPQFQPDMAAMAQALNDDQKKRMEEALVMFKQQQQAAKDLLEERRRFGSKNIDVLLTREAEVTKAWSEMMGIGALAVPTPAQLQPGAMQPPPQPAPK